MTKSTTGMLYLVSTPIGNLEDMTFRALRTLKESDLIAAEDTRRTRLLLKHFDIHTKVDSFHDFNKEKKTSHLISLLKQGKTIAIVSDAGTPGISDPAFTLVREAAKETIPIVPIPGATAAIAALIISGLPTDRFVFEGFLPAKKGRQKRLNILATEHRTIILYESPHRLMRTLNDLQEIVGDRNIAVCRELTKKFEEATRGKLSEILSHFSQRKIQGEFVLVVQGCLNKHDKIKK